MSKEDLVNSFIDKVRGRGLRVVLPEGEDERVIEAARRLKDEKIAEPILLGDSAKIKAASEGIGVGLDGIKIIGPKQNERIEDYAQKYAKGRDNMSVGVAKRLIGKPVFYAGMMVACGDAETFVGGVAHATATVIQSAALTIGMAKGINTVSSFFLMIVPEFRGEKDKPFVFADCAVNVEPTAEELADIALASAESAGKILSEEVRVAFISYSTKGSGIGESVDRVRKAVEVAKRRGAGIAIDGEFQVDSAIIPEVAARKVKEPSDVAGRANVLVFADLDSGNVAYKLTQYMAGAAAVGPFLQGFARPVSDLSRGASVEDIICATAITLAQL